ncbi:MAG: hypothetical protein WD716_03520 [Fimbriimonadaceae bacterium]
MSAAPFKRLLGDIVVEEVPSTVRATMSEEQLKAVRSAADRRHAVDLRFTVPLVFTQLYFVLLIGKDQRREGVAVQKERRARAGLYISSFAAGVIATVIVAVIAVTMYLLKSKAGINVFPDHVRDWIPFVK